MENANEKMDNLEKLKETSQEAGEFFSVSYTVKGCSIELFAHAACNIIMTITNVKIKTLALKKEGQSSKRTTSS